MLFLYIAGALVHSVVGVYHRSVWLGLMMHRRVFRTSHRGCAASQRVAGLMCLQTHKNRDISNCIIAEKRINNV